jgi:membrane protein implicated in regulation of membrane protease activity
MTDSPGRRKPLQWKDLSRGQTYALIQHQVLFLALFGAVIYLLASRKGVTAVLAFGAWLVFSSLVVLLAVKLRRRRDRNRSLSDRGG